MILPTPSSHTESKDSARELKPKENKNFYQVDIPSTPKFSGNDVFLNNIESEKQDLTEKLGELTLRQIQIIKDKSQRLFPIYPDTIFKSFWDLIAMFFICYHALVIPYRYCFKARAFGWLRLFELMIDVFFIADLCKFRVKRFCYSFEFRDWLLQNR